MSIKHGGQKCFIAKKPYIKYMNLCQLIYMNAKHKNNIWYILMEKLWLDIAMLLVHNYHECCECMLDGTYEARSFPCSSNGSSKGICQKESINNEHVTHSS
jgi:hypothetical protein